ncbi:hypothetical protein [Actinomadura sp. 9N215]|uniref:hypothetical protein n=1 Tax=Actinomadura sp. 9N215 TaxID=3375150 RepID=UPI00379F2F46
MKQPSEGNGHEDEGPETAEHGQHTPVYVPESEIPTVTFPLPDDPSDVSDPSDASADEDEDEAVQPPGSGKAPSTPFSMSTFEDDSAGENAPPDQPTQSVEPTSDILAGDDGLPGDATGQPASTPATPAEGSSHATDTEPAGDLAAPLSETGAETEAVADIVPSQDEADADAEPEADAPAAAEEAPHDAVDATFDDAEAAGGVVRLPGETGVGTESAVGLPGDDDALGGQGADADQDARGADGADDVPDEEDVVLDPRSGFGTMPLPEIGDTPPLGTEAAEDGWGGRELVESVYGSLTEFYEHIDARLREVPEDVPPVGWVPHVAALRALREQRVAGDWEVLARFLVAPGSLEETEALRLVQTEDGDDVVHDTVKELTAADGRALLVAPTPERAAELLRSLEDDPEVFSLMIETQPATAEARSVETQALPPVDEGGAPEPPPVRKHGSSGTVEFKPLTGPPEPETVAAEPETGPPEPETGPDRGADEASSAATRVEPLPAVPEGEPVVPAEGPSAPETRVRSAALRPVGEAWRLSWETEARLLRRGLMWLEQWPRDAAALQAVQAENLRRREARDAERAALTATIEESRNAAAVAEQAAGQAEAEAERLTAVQAEAEAELAGPRAEAERLRTIADEAAAEANALTRTADASYARCVQLDERAKTAQAELQGARQAEASLTDELARAREALPGAAEEAHRLTAADADAAAEGHAAYYRLVSAESALSAMRRKMTLGQRLHVASPPSELRSLRDDVKARTREADEAAKRAREAKDVAEHAERVRRGLASFVSEGGARLQQAQEAQERLGTELTWLATERDSAGGEHQEQARLASAAVEKANQEGRRAHAAQQAAQAVQDRVNAARAARDEALAAARQARSDAEAAATRAADTAAALDRHTAEAAAELSARQAELDTVAGTEARSRENVLEICGSDPAENPAAVPAHQRRAMARIEQLTAYMDGQRSAEGDVLLRTADLVVGTPTGVGLTARDEEFDALIVADAGAVTDAEFLIGAVRARRWILVSAPGVHPPKYREYADALEDGSPSGARPSNGGERGLEDGPFGRAATASPHLVDVR